MHRFFLSSQTLQSGALVDLSSLVVQLLGVLRLQAGAQIVLLDNSGDEFLTEIVWLERKGARGKVFAQQRCLAEPTRMLTLYQCTLKADKFEWVLQKCTELGVARFVPVISERSIVRPASAVLNKYDRWQSILREAAEQCGRGKIPELAQPRTWTQAIQDASGEKLMAWEEGRLEIRRLGDWLHSQSPNLLISPSLHLLIGPEGGITAAEALQAQAAGWQTVSLGKRILRAETAAVAATAILMADD